MPALTLVSTMTRTTAATAVVYVSVGSGKVRRIIVVVQGGGTSLGEPGENVKRALRRSSVFRLMVTRPASGRMS